MTNGQKYHKARSVLQALIHGKDPVTENELPDDSIVNRIEVNRALLTAADAIEKVQARELRRALLPAKVGRTWTDEEQKQLVQEFASGETIHLIAEKHSRTVRAIEARAERMGLLRPDQRTTNNSFTGSPVKEAE